MAALEDGIAAGLAVDEALKAFVAFAQVSGKAQERARACYRESHDESLLVLVEEFETASAMCMAAVRALCDARSRMEGGQLAFLREVEGDGEEA